MFNINMLVLLMFNIELILKNKTKEQIVQLNFTM